MFCSLIAIVLCVSFGLHFLFYFKKRNKFTFAYFTIFWFHCACHIVTTISVLFCNPKKKQFHYIFSHISLQKHSHISIQIFHFPAPCCLEVPSHKKNKKKETQKQPPHCNFITLHYLCTACPWQIT